MKRTAWPFGQAVFLPFSSDRSLAVNGSIFAFLCQSYLEPVPVSKVGSLSFISISADIDE